MSRRLFDIQHEYLKTLEELEDYFVDNDIDGEIPDEFLERLSINKNEALEKLDNYRLWMLSLESEVDILANDVKKLQNKIKAKEKTISWIKDVMGKAVKQYGSTDLKSKAEIPSIKLASTHNNYTFVFKPKIMVGEELPEDYKKYNITLKDLTPDNLNKIKEVLSNMEGILSLPKIENKPDLEKIKIRQHPESILGVTVDYEAGYIKMS